MATVPAPWSQLASVHGMDPAEVLVAFGSYRLTFERPAWQSQAACRDEPRSTFFSERGGSVARARELCAGCTVRVECLEYAIAGDECGTWGGMSERERRRMMRERARAKAA